MWPPPPNSDYLLNCTARVLAVQLDCRIRSNNSKECCRSSIKHNHVSTVGNCPTSSRSYRVLVGRRKVHDCELKRSSNCLIRQRCKHKCCSWKGEGCIYCWCTNKQLAVKQLCCCWFCCISDGYSRNLFTLCNIVFKTLACYSTVCSIC